MKWYQIGDASFDLEKVGAIVEEKTPSGALSSIKIYVSGGQGSPVIAVTGPAMKSFQQFMLLELKPKKIHFAAPKKKASPAKPPSSPSPADRP